LFRIGTDDQRNRWIKTVMQGFHGCKKRIEVAMHQDAVASVQRRSRLIHAPTPRQRRFNLLVHFKHRVWVTMEVVLQPMPMIHMKTPSATELHPMLRTVEAGLNPHDIGPQQGQLYHLAGPGRSGASMRPVVEHWVVQALSIGQTVHWIDGACRIDPGRFIPLLRQQGAPIEPALSRLFLSRGFTLHQLDHQIERLSAEIAITQSRLIVVDGLLTMHQDDAVRRRESRVLLRRHLTLLTQLAHERHLAVVVITASHHDDRHLQNRLVDVHRASHNHLIGRRAGRTRRSTLVLHHPRSGRSGPWKPPRNAQTMFRVLPRDRSTGRQRIQYPVLADEAANSDKRR
jgi:hypothetical protein